MMIDGRGWQARVDRPAKKTEEEREDVRDEIERERERE